jgi:hypothetical protein
MKTLLEKAQQMLRIEAAQEILFRRTLGTDVDMVKAAFFENRTIPLLVRIATLMLPGSNKQQVIMTLSQELNLSPQEERALQHILSSS